MFEILLMRHAESDFHRDLSDSNRPLNRSGRQDALRMGAYLKQAGLTPDIMVVSAAERTQETARLLQESIMMDGANIIIDQSLYLADMDVLCENITLYAKPKQRLLLLAHNPGMDYLVQFLAKVTPSLSRDGELMAPCAVACFYIASLDDLAKSGESDCYKLIRPDELMN